MLKKAHGRLHAIGTSLSLKRSFGSGYRISLTVDPLAMEFVKDAIKGQSPDAHLEDDSAGALIYQIPRLAGKVIPALLSWLDQQAGDDGDIKSWGISQTTLEKVFLEIIRKANPDGYY